MTDDNEHLTHLMISDDVLFYQRINAPPGSPPGTPPINRGRPLSEWCGKVKETPDGKKTDWGNVPYDLIYGPNGFCEKEVGGGPCE